MKQFRKMLILAVALLMLSVLASCRGLSDRVRANKLADEITEHTALLANVLENSLFSDTSTTERALDSLLHQSLVMDELQINGESLPVTLFWKEDMISIQGDFSSALMSQRDPSSESSRTLVKLFKQGMVTLVTKDDFTDAQVTPFDSGLAEMPISLRLELLPELLRLEGEDLTVNTDTWVYSLSEERVEALSKTLMDMLGVDEKYFEDSDGFDLSALIAVDIDMRHYEERKLCNVKLSAKGEKKPITLQLSFDEDDGVQTVTMTTEPEEDTRVKLSVSVENERLTALSCELKVLENNEEVLLAQLEYVSPSEYVMGFNMEVDLPSAMANGLMSEFGGSSIESESCKVQLQCLLLNDAAGNIAKIGVLGRLLSDEKNVINLDFVYTPGNLKQVDEDCLKIGLTMQGEESEESALVLSVDMRTLSASEYRLAFSVDAATSEAQGVSADRDAVEGSFRIRLTDEVEIAINDTEKLYLERSEKVFDNYESVASWIRGLNRGAVDYYTKNRNDLQTAFYTQTREGFVFFTDIYRYGGQFYIRTECVVDYEDQLDLRAKNLANIVSHEKGGLDNIAKTIKQKNTAQATGKKIIGSAPQYVICAPIKGQEQYYVLWYSDGVVTYTTGKPDPMLYHGYHMHWTDSDFNDIHDWEISYDHECKKILTCQICGLQCYDDYDAFSHLNYTWRTVQNLTETEPKIRIRHCEACGKTNLQLLDSEERKVNIMLSALTEYDMEMFEYFGVGDAIPTDEICLVVHSFDFTSPRSSVFDRDIDLSVLEDLIDFRIIGVYGTIDDCDLGDCSIIIPEGVVCFNLYGSNTVRAKTIVLPDSIQYFKNSVTLILQEEPILPE